MNPINRFPTGKALKLARAALILAAATLAASCVTPKPPLSEKMALTKTAAERKAGDKKGCAKQVISQVQIDKLPKERTVPGSEWEPCVNYQPGLVQSDSTKDGKSEDALIIAALSGGGKRSAAFAYGVFQALQQVTIDLPKARRADKAAEFTPRSLLEEIDLISAVSGGAMTASYYALHRNNTFLPEQNASCGYESFLYEDTGWKIKGLYFFPWNWGWLIDSSYGSNDVMAKFFSERLFGMPAGNQYRPKKQGELLTASEEQEDLRSYCAQPTDDRPNGAIYADLYDQGPPYLLLSSTDLTRGLTFPYSQDGFDFICADLSEFPLGWALAGTNAFPVVLSTVNLRNNHADRDDGNRCNPKRNVRLSEIFKQKSDCVPLESILDDSSEVAVPQDNKFFRSKTLLETATTCYARPGDAAYVHLADGGMTDNFGLKSITDWFHTHIDTPSFWYLVHTTKRAQLLIIDGQRDVDPKIARSAQGPDVLDAVGTMISNSVDQSNISSFAEIRDLFDVLSTYLAVRDVVIIDEWQRAAYGEQNYDANSLKQFTDFLDCIEKLSTKNVICRPVHETFEQRYNIYVANIRTLYGNLTDLTTGEAELRSRFYPISSGVNLIWNGEYYGATGARINWRSDQTKGILGSNLRGLGMQKTNSAGIDDFLKANILLRGKLERVKEFHERSVSIMKAGKPVVVRYPNYWVDISKISAVDDCISHRRNLLMSSDTGMGLDRDVIEAAIEAGKDVAKRHTGSILSFLNKGERWLPTNCQTWVGSKPASAGAKTADPQQ